MDPHFDKSSILDHIILLFKEKGASRYGGEDVSQEEHALQAAMLAQQQGAPTSLIVAALLHDIGHLLHVLPDDAPEKGIDDVHEKIAFHFLKKHFLDEVTQPVAMHVDAKRYLCSRDPDYLNRLSEPSKISLALQGGPMTEQECQTFEQHPFFKDAIQLRRWDELAKDPDWKGLEIAPFLPLIAQCLK